MTLIVTDGTQCPAIRRIESQFRVLGPRLDVMSVKMKLHPAALAVFTLRFATLFTLISSIAKYQSPPMSGFGTFPCSQIFGGATTLLRAGPVLFPVIATEPWKEL